MSKRPVITFPDCAAESQPAEAIRPVSLADVMAMVDCETLNGRGAFLRPLETGFHPLDDVLNGGIRPGELLLLGGPAGVGKTIWALQTARNAVVQEPDVVAMVVCYEHDNAHLMSRLMCLESAELGYKGDALTLRKLAEMQRGAAAGVGLSALLRQTPRYAQLLDAMAGYADRLLLTSASGDHTTLDEIRGWAEHAVQAGASRLLLVIDYLQKVPVGRAVFDAETEVTTYLTHRLKEIAKALKIPVIAVAAADRAGLKSKRMRFADLRGSSALQYEADVGMMLNNKFTILSREHMVYNPAQADAMRGYVVMSIEKNRSGLGMVDMEYPFDPAHFRFIRQGGFVRERLVDEKLVLE